MMAIDWLTANHASPAVANISLDAGGLSTSLENSIQNSIASGITYTIAAGNSNMDACMTSPAHTPNALTVGASYDHRYPGGIFELRCLSGRFRPGNGCHLAKLCR